MKELNVTPLPLERVRVMVGRGLEKLLEEAVGPKLAPRGVLLFRERYAEIVDEETILLPDVPEVLDRLAGGRPRDGGRVQQAGEFLPPDSRREGDPLAFPGGRRTRTQRRRPSRTPR